MMDAKHEEQIRELFKAQSQQLADLAALIDADNEAKQLPQIIAQKWPTILDAVSDSISLLDPTATILWCNKAAADLLGEPQSKIIGSKCWELMHGTNEPIENCPMLRTRKTLEREATVIRKDDRWFEGVIYPLLDKKARIFGFIHTLTDITEHKRAEEALRASKEKYRAIFENTGTAVAIINEDTTVSMANTRFEKLSGYSKEEMLGKSWTELIFKEDLPRMKEYHRLRRFDPNKVPSQYECRYYHKQGDIRHMSLTVSMVPGTKKSVVSVIDITEQKQAEEKVKRQRALLEATNKVLLEALTCETDEQVARTCLAAAEELTGSRFGFIGEVNQAGRVDTIAISNPGWEACRIPKTDAVKAIHNMEIRGLWGSVVKQEKSLIVNNPSSHPESVGTPKGHPLITSFLAAPLKHRGKTIGMIALGNKASGYDMSDQQAIEDLSVAFVEALMRKRAEKALQESEKRYRAIFESTREGILTSDSEGRVMRVNPAAVRMLGYKNEKELLGIPVTKFYGDPIVREKLLKELSRKGYMETEVEIRKKDGTLFTALVSLTANCDDEGKVLCIDGVFRDISERKKAEQAIKEERDRAQGYLDVAGAMLVALNHDGEVTLVNRKGCSILEYEENEIVGKNWFGNFLPKTTKDKVKLIFHKLMAGEIEAVEYYENPVLTKSGKVGLIAWRNTVLRDAAGTITGTLSSGEDITERKRAEEALEQKNIALREMIEQIDLERRKIEENVALNVNETMLPIIEELKQKGTPPQYLDLLKHELEKLTSTFGRKIQTKSSKLTAREIEICHLIEGGLSSKEISALMNISKQTVEKHRKNIRKKLGITNKSISLNTYLHEL